MKTVSAFTIVVSLVLTACDQKGTSVQRPANGIRTFAGASPQSSPVKYPLGHDTVEFWNAGRFRVALNTLLDQELSSGDPCVLQHVLAFRQEGDKVYFKSPYGLAILHVGEARIEAIAIDQLTSHPDKESFERLDKRVAGNVRIDPTTYDVVRE